MQRMKILLVAGFSDSLIGFRKPLIVALLNQGLTVHVAAPELSTNKKALSELRALGVKTHDISMQRTGMNPFSDLLALFSIWKLMRRVKPNYFLGYTIKPVIYGSLAALLARVPNRFALITGLGFAFIGEEGGARSKIRALVQGLYRFALSNADTVFFQNPDDEGLFRELGILSLNSKSLVVNGSGVDVSQFEVAPLDLKKPIKFLLIARLLGDKGVREYVKAAVKVKKSYTSGVFDLVGWIDENPDSITQAELDSWVSADAVNFLGRLSDVRPAISDCSVYVLPSYREGTPRTVLEAMAIGRAVITTDAPGCRETVVDGDNGYLVPIKDSDSLAIAMLRFIENPELIKEMGHRSRIIAEEKYDVHKVNKQMLIGMGLNK
jgi:glycosyltransferase involved in cell wall biosynthesis